MAKINLNFNNADYQIDESALADATNALKSHLSTTMAGTGAKVSLGGVDYNIDSTKLSTATNNFITHLGTIAGSGAEVVVNGTKYSVDSTKLSGATSALSTAFDILSGGTTPDTPTEERLEGDGAAYYSLAPTALSFRSTAPLNEFQSVQINGVTVDPANYTLEEGSTIVTLPIDYLKTLNVGSYEVAVVSQNKTVNGNFTVAAPNLNEYGFYYNQPYAAYVEFFGGNTVFFLREGGTMDVTVLDNGYVETCYYTADGNNLTINAAAGTFTGTASEASIYCNELYTNFILGDTSTVADEDYIYIYKEDLGGYEVVAIDKTKAEYGAIKTGINGIATVKLADGAFAVSTNIYQKHENFIHCPTIPDSVTTIGDWAFYGCENLISITIPSSVTSIGSSAFYNCSSLTSIVVPNSVTSIGSNAFANCTGLTRITIPNGVTSIRYGLCQTCRGLTSVVIGNNVNRIEYDAFKMCDNLTSIVIPDSVTFIGHAAFRACRSLASITFTGTIEQWKAINIEHTTYNDLWNSEVPATYVTCSDGTVELS